MSISDLIQLISIGVSTLTSVIGISLSVKAIRQTNVANNLTRQSAEDMARPYVNIFVDAFSVKTEERVYVIKNFGSSPAYIISILVNGDIGNLNRKHFQSLVNNMLAPGQKKTSTIDKEFKGSSEITVHYKDVNEKIYVDTFKLDTQIFEDFAFRTIEASKSEKTASAIRQSTLALLRELK